MLLVKSILFVFLSLWKLSSGSRPIEWNITAVTSDSLAGQNNTFQCKIDYFGPNINATSDGVLTITTKDRKPYVVHDLAEEKIHINWPSSSGNRYSYNSTTHTILIRDVDCTDERSLICTLTAINGSEVSSRAYFTVKVPPGVPHPLTTIPANLSMGLNQGESVSATCTANTGRPGKGRIQWRIYKDTNEAILEDGDSRVWTSETTTPEAEKTCTVVSKSTLKLDNLNSSSDGMVLACSVINADFPSNSPDCQSSDGGLCQQSPPIEINQLYCADKVEVGSKLVLASLMTVWDGPANFSVTWKSVTGNQTYEWSTCYSPEGVCVNLLQGPQAMLKMANMSDTDGIIMWSSGLMFDEATEEMTGQWRAEWEVSGFNYDYSCDVEVVGSESPTPMASLISITSKSSSAIISFEVAKGLTDLKNMINGQILQYFFLEIFLDNEPIFVEKEAAVGETETGSATITYTIFGLKASRKYNGQLTVVGSDVEFPTTFEFTTPRVDLDTPFIYSPQPSIVGFEENVKLNCSSTEDGVDFQWFHNEKRLGEEDGIVLKRKATNSTAGSYRCQITRDSQLETSGTYNLIVVDNADFYTHTSTTSITLDLEYTHDLSNASSEYFHAVEFYFQDLIKNAMMMTRRNFLGSTSMAFMKGSVVSLTLLYERLLYAQPSPTSAAEFLHRKLVSGLADTYKPKQVFNLRYDDLSPVGNEQTFIEGKPVSILCKFTILSTMEPEFNVVWTLNQSVIDQTRSSTFEFTRTSQNLAWPSLEPLRTYRYNYILKIKDFLMRLTGKYGCEIRAKMLQAPFKLTDVDNQEMEISPLNVVRRPVVNISPLSVLLHSGSSVVRIACNATFAKEIYVMDDNNKVVVSNVKNGKTTEVTVKADVKGLYCTARSSPDIDSTSETCHIYRVNDATTVFCGSNTDKRDVFWEKRPAGTFTNNCPKGYSGRVTRVCQSNGEWEDSNYIGCSKQELENIRIQIDDINNDGIRPTQTEITDISEDVGNTVVGEDKDVFAGDIVQVVDILDKVKTAVVIDVERDDQENLVDTKALENFADAANSILSKDDSTWDEVITSKSGTTTNSDAASKLAVALDKIAVASLSGNGSGAIVKENVAIQRETIELEDIVFPDLRDNNYKNHDKWVVKSKTSLRLSAKNFPAEQIQYSVVLLNGIDSKIVVDSKAQSRYKVGRKFKNLELSSDVISLSLSKDISKFSSPLDLNIEITKTNNSNPVCGYLDTSLGDTPIWSNKGCRTVNVDAEVVTCHCNHLTSFAILMSPHNTDDDEHHEILNMVTYVGCGISILCLIITIVVHAVTWKYVKENRSILHINLSVVLILAYAAFLAGIDRTEDNTVCTAVALLLHFLFLTVFSIMLVEGVQIFVSVTFVFSTNIHLNVWLFMAYFVPLAIVGVTYGLTYDDDYRDPDFCWLSIDTGTLWAFIGPALLVILVNFVIMCLALRAMMSTVTMKVKNARAKAKSAMRAVCVLSPIFGITWVFGVFSLSDDLVVFQYLFAIFNTLQGFLVFLFYCILNNQVKDGLRHMRRKHRSRSLASGEDLSGKRSKGMDSSSNRKMSDSSDFSDSVSKTVTTPVTDTKDVGGVFPFPTTSNKQEIINPVFQRD